MVAAQTIGKAFPISRTHHGEKTLNGCVELLSHHIVECIVFARTTILEKVIYQRPVLGFAHLDEHRPLRNETVDLRQLITDCATDARALQPERPIEVDVPAVPVVVAGDPHRLEQVVVALTHNALTHTSRDARLRLSTRSLEGG